MQVDFFEMVRKMAACWNVNAAIVNSRAEVLPSFDLGLRKSILEDEQPALRAFFSRTPLEAMGDRVYNLVDCFEMDYTLFWLPAECGEPGDVLVLGPLWYSARSRDECDRICDCLGLPESLYDTVWQFFDEVPIIASVDTWSHFQENICQIVYPKQGLHFDSFGLEYQNRLWGTPRVIPRTELTEQQNERQFVQEQSIMNAIAAGDTQKALELLYKSWGYSDKMKRNLAGQLARAEGYWSWAARLGGVHPKVIQQKEQQFQRKFGNVTTARERDELLQQMITGFCELVQNYSFYHASTLVRDVGDEIYQNLGEEISLQKIAERKNVNASYLSARFKREMGLSLMEYVQYERIHFAIRRFDAGAASIQEVAMQCGILDQGYFCKCFKKETGKSPSAYIAEVQRKK